MNKKVVIESRTSVELKENKAIIKAINKKGIDKVFFGAIAKVQVWYKDGTSRLVQKRDVEIKQGWSDYDSENLVNNLYESWVIDKYGRCDYGKVGRIYLTNAVSILIVTHDSHAEYLDLKNVHINILTTGEQAELEENKLIRLIDKHNELVDMETEQPAETDVNIIYNNGCYKIYDDTVSQDVDENRIEHAIPVPEIEKDIDTPLYIINRTAEIMMLAKELAEMFTSDDDRVLQQAEFLQNDLQTIFLPYYCNQLYSQYSYYKKQYEIASTYFDIYEDYVSIKVVDGTATPLVDIMDKIYTSLLIDNELLPNGNDKPKDIIDVGDWGEFFDPVYDMNDFFENDNETEENALMRLIDSITEEKEEIENSMETNEMSTAVTDNSVNSEYFSQQADTTEKKSVFKDTPAETVEVFDDIFTKYDVVVEVKFIKNRTYITATSPRYKKLPTVITQLVKALKNYKPNRNKIQLFSHFLKIMSSTYKHDLRLNKFPDMGELNKTLTDFQLLELYYDYSENAVNIIYDYNEPEKEETTTDMIKLVNGHYLYTKNTQIDGVTGLYVALTPSHKKQFRGNNLSWDIETTTRDGISQMCSFSLADNSHNWAYTTTVVADNDVLIVHALNLITSCVSATSKKVSVDVHNLSFDISYVLSYLLKQGFDCVESSFIKPLAEKQFSMVYNQGVICCSVLWNGVQIDFSDTFRLMSKSLDKISSFIESPNIIRKASTSFDYEQSKAIGYTFNETECIYCINDVVVLSYIKQFFGNILYGNTRLTASATAYSEWELSTQYGMYNVDVYKYAINIQLAKKNITEKNYTNYIKNGYLKSYYNENEPVGTSFDDFKIAVSNCNITKKEVDSFCSAHSIVYNYFKDVARWSTDFIVTYFLQTTNRKHYKKQIANRKKAIEYYLPSVSYDIDEKFRHAYYGGVTACNLTKIGVKHENINGYSIDINSSYPDKCYNYKMPVGMPERLEGEQAYNEIKNAKVNKSKQNNYIYLINATMSVRLKSGMLPILINSKRMFASTTQISNGTETRLVTLNELQTIERIYHCKPIILVVYKFKAVDFIFKSYYERYFSFKANAKNKDEKEVAKVLLNGLYGKFGENLFIRQQKTTIAILDGSTLRFSETMNDDVDMSDVKGKYLFIAIFITSYARCHLINAVADLVENGLEVFYTDTDSIYFEIPANCTVTIDGIVLTERDENTSGNLIINGNKTNIFIHSKKLGAWDIEHHFTTFVAYAPKRYGLIENGNHFVKCAGVSKKIQETFTIEDISYNKIQRSIQSSMGVLGREIANTFKSLCVPTSIGYVYQCTDGTSLTTLEPVEIGATVENVYRQPKTISKLIASVKH